MNSIEWFSTVIWRIKLKITQYKFSANNVPMKTSWIRDSFSNRLIRDYWGKSTRSEKQTLFSLKSAPSRTDEQHLRGVDRIPDEHPTEFSFSGGPFVVYNCSGQVTHKYAGILRLGRLGSDAGLRRSLPGSSVMARPPPRQRIREFWNFHRPQNARLGKTSAAGANSINSGGRSSSKILGRGRLWRHAKSTARSCPSRCKLGLR